MKYDAILKYWNLSMGHQMRTGVPSIRGEIYDDKQKRFDDGDIISTSPVKSIDFETMIATTKSGTRYLLD